MLKMTSKNRVVSYILAALSGVCFATGIVLLSDEGSAMSAKNEENINE